GRQMIDARHQRAELLSVRAHAADGNSAEADAMIAALATDQSHARRLAAHVVVRERDLERGVYGLGAGVAEENVIEVGGRERGDSVRERERLRISELEWRNVIDRLRFGPDRLDDRLAIMPRVRAPHARNAVENRAALGRVVVHALCA